MTNYSERLAALELTGDSAAKIASILQAEGYVTSRTSVGRALRKLRGSRRVGSRSDSGTTTEQVTTPVSAPSVPTENEIATTRDLTSLDRWLEMFSAMAREAQARGDLAGQARAGSLAIQTFEARRKATPSEEKPAGVFVAAADMEALAAVGEARLLRLLEEALPADGPRCPTCGHHT